MATAKISLEELLAKIPEQFRDIARAVIPQLLATGQVLAEDWLRLVLAGDYQKATETALANLDTEAAIGEGDKIVERLRQANLTEAERREFYKSVCLAVLQAFIAIAAGAVVL
ncbi:hypothetical protein ES708_18121 [subsurface metagenome]